MENSEKITRDSSSIVKKLFLLFLVFAGLHYAKGFLIPLIIGGLLATLFLPLCKKLEQKKVPRGLAAFISVLLVLIILSTMISLLGWQISGFTNDLDLIKQKSIETTDSIQKFILNKFGLSTANQTQLIKGQQDFVVGLISNFLESLTSVLIDLLLVIAYLFFLLFYRSHIKSFILKLSNAEHQKNTEQVIERATHVSQQYLLGIFKMIICLWIMYGIGFSLIGVENPLTFAILCGLLEIVPYVGNLTGTIITVLVSAVNGESISVLGGIVIIYGTIQFIQGWFLEPLILGPQVKINPLFTIIALVIGEIVWGIPGIILAIPITAIFKIICDHIDSLKPYGFLIGETKTRKLRKPKILKS